MEPELTPTTLGELLMRARFARGHSLAKVEQDTRIRRRYLEALEADDLAALPAPVFTRGLVRAYAAYLGVDQIEAAELLNKGEARAESFGVRPTVSTGPVSTPAPGGLPLRAFVFAAALGVLGIGVGLILPRYTSLLAPATAVAQSRTPTAEAAIVAPAVAPTVQPTPTAVPTVAPTATPQPSATLAPQAQATANAAAAQRGVTIEAKTLGRVWVQVESDGQVSFSGILQPGERKVWRAEKRLSLYVGDAGLVDVTYNGLALGQIGAKGEVAKKEWTASR